MQVAVSYSSSLMTGNPWTPKSDQEDSDAISRRQEMRIDQNFN